MGGVYNFVTKESNLYWYRH